MSHFYEDDFYKAISSMNLGAVQPSEECITPTVQDLWDLSKATLPPGTTIPQGMALQTKQLDEAFRGATKRANLPYAGAFPKYAENKLKTNLRTGEKKTRQMGLMNPIVPGADTRGISTGYRIEGRSRTPQPVNKSITMTADELWDLTKASGDMVVTKPTYNKKGELIGTMSQNRTALGPVGPKSFQPTQGGPVATQIPTDQVLLDAAGKAATMIGRGVKKKGGEALKTAFSPESPYSWPSIGKEAVEWGKKQPGKIKQWGKKQLDPQTWRQRGQDIADWADRKINE